jgi:hypothetical protein
MKRETRYTLQGQVKTTTKMDLASLNLVVLAYAEGQQVACGEVNSKGGYKLSFEWGEEPPSLELRVTPAKMARSAQRGPVFTKTLSPNRFVGRRRSPLVYEGIYDLKVPAEYLVYIGKITKTYRLHGVVYAATFVDIMGTPTLTAVDPLPGVRLEFYEVDSPPFIIPFGSPLTLGESSLGYAYSDPVGAYEFSFDFSYSNAPYGPIFLINDKVPDIRVRISQYIAGLWTEVYEGPVDWNIALDAQRDYFIPVEDVMTVPDNGVKPAEGFRFNSLGLLPIDTTRFVDGYVTSQPGDPVTVSKQPLCGTLRIFGYFASAPPVVTYSVEMAAASATTVTGAWLPVADVLTNSRWNDVTKAYDSVGLGPDPVTGRYINIDTEPEADWHEHGLKITWASANHANGYYALRITGYDAANVAIGTYQMPIVCVDNTPPTASIAAISPAPTACGALQLAAARQITFEITAYDSEGHVLEYTLSGTRGLAASAAGASLSETRPSPTGTWTGRLNHSRVFTVAAMPAGPPFCTMMAYNFELHVWGSPTNCYATKVEAQHVKKETNLVVAEP